MEIRFSSFLRFFLIYILCWTLLPCQVLYADTVPDERQTVSVGVVLQPGFVMRNESGIYFGFDAEYMYKIAQYANLKPVFQPYDTIGDMFSGLDNGEIQMALGISPNPERKERFLFANTGFFSSQASVRVRKDDSRFSYGNPAEFDGKKLGVVSSSIMYTRAQEWVQRSNIQPEFILFDNDDKLYAAMDAGELDGIITFTAKYSQSYRAAFNIVANTYYPIFGRNQIELKNKVDAAMNRILYEDPLYPEKVHDKYRHYREDEALPLSEEEKAYINNHPVLRVAFLVNQAPFSFINSDGAVAGITADLYRQIAKELNWQVEFKPYGNRREVAEALHAGEVDIYGITTQDIIASEEKGLALTKTYFTLNMFTIKRTDVTDIHTAAFIGRVPPNVEKMLRDRFGDVEFKGYGSIDQCYDALTDKRVDAVFCNMAQLNWLTSRRETDELLVEGIENIYIECCGQLLPENYLLNSILSKTVQGSNIDVVSIISRNVYTKTTTMDYLRTIPTRLVVMFFVFVLLITILVSRTIYISHKKQVSAELSAKQAALDASERARETESNFLSSMSHDMRTPLNGILGYTRLARGSDNKEEMQQYLKRIDDSGKLMLALVNDVLDLSKLASGKMELREDRIVPHELFGLIKSAITMNAETHHIDFKAELHGDEGLLVYSDRLRLQQLAMNLLSNAVKYTPAGGHVVWDVWIKDVNGEQAILRERIQDDGIGMSEDFQQHMFDIFTQEIRKETLGTRGTGLGLSLVHKFIELMGGTIQVDSHLNQGTVFTFEVPIKVGPVDTGETGDGEDGATNKVDIPNDLLKDVPILLVEDNAINAELTQLMLADYGANMIDWAHNGLEGLEIYSASEPTHYQLIIMDLRMPVMDGLTATRKIRSLHRPDAGIVPIIAMSADAYEEDIQNCKDAGMQAHVSKPVDVDVLMKIIAGLI